MTLVSARSSGGSPRPRRALVDVLDPELRPRDLDPRVTLEHLLTHTSGIADYCDEYGDEPYEAVWLRANPNAMRAPTDLLPLFADLPALAEPGAEVRYCNAGFVLAGLAVEAHRGRVLLRCRRGGGARARRDGGHRVPGPRRRDPRHRDRVPAAARRRSRRCLAVQPVRDPGPRPARRRGVLHGGGPGAVPGRVPGRAAWWAPPGATRCSGRASATSARRRPTAWPGGCPARAGGGWVGHPGGDPGYVARVRWYPEAGIRLVVLANRSNRAGPAAALAEELLVG